MRRVLSGILLTLIFSLCSPLFSQVTELKPEGFINDYTNTLSEQEKVSLESLVASIEKETSAEIGVAIIQSLESRDIEGYANEIFNEWGVGKKGKDNGVLILVSLNDRKIRIETGYGIEPVLPDALCGRIIRNIMAPRFRENNYYKGIYDAITTIAQCIKGEEPPAAAAALPDRGKFISFLILWHGFLLFFAFSIFRKPGIIIYLALVVPLGVIALISGRYGPSAAMGLMMLVPFFLVFFMGLLAPVIYTIIAWRMKRRYKKDWKKHIPVYINRAVSHTRSSGGGGFSGGGFGGGSSGGGGASGGW
jgi:uncharacterized protein